MSESFDSDLNAYLRDEDAKVDRCEEIADDLTVMFTKLAITGKGELYMNGNYKGDFDLNDAIAYAQEHDDDDNWVVTELDE
jgi:hypothetical protein